jgi:tripartite-type tricarboxylate transporter receptor subunit TctC
MSTRRSVASLATTTTAVLVLTSAASAFPDKLLQFVTPYPFGGSHALHASIITTVAEPHFGQPMISVIRTGDGGVVGAEHVLKSGADGHVMLFGDPNLNSLRPQVEQLSFSVASIIRLGFSSPGPTHPSVARSRAWPTGPRPIPTNSSTAPTT